MPKIRVAVIGAGAAGLSAAGYLSARQDAFEFVVYEKTGRVGGTWAYVEETGKDQYGQRIHSSIYQNLITNLPKEVMAFPDFPFKDSLPSFMRHEDVLQYLEDYANYFQFNEHIKFWTSVEKVSPLRADGKDKWVVEVKQYIDHSSPVESSSVFDAVMVCNGKYSVPYMPEIPGLETFTGPYSHSHAYRHPEPYKDQVVAILGASFSGVDIALDLTKSAKRIFLCHWKPRLLSRLPDNVEQVAAVNCIESGNVVVTEDGHEYQVDAILACTGYEWSFPFLSPECQMTINNKRIHELYMHMFDMRYPSMSFIGIPYRTIPFPQYSLQTKFVLGVLEGRISLPTGEKMEAEEIQNLAQLLQVEGGAEKLFHVLGRAQWSYNKMLAQKGSIEELSPRLETLAGEIMKRMETNAVGLKKLSIRLIDPDSWEILEDNHVNHMSVP